MSKLEGFCFAHTGDITGIEFLSPHPLMVTSSMDGKVCIWGLRPVHINYKYICLYMFENFSYDFSKDVKCAVTRMAACLKEMKGIKKHTRIKEGML